MRRRRSPNDGDKSDNLVNGEGRSPESTARSLRMLTSPSVTSFRQEKGTTYISANFCLFGWGKMERGIGWGDGLPIFWCPCRVALKKQLCSRKTNGMVYLCYIVNNVRVQLGS